jgi:magnesium chelatase family protein
LTSGEVGSETLGDAGVLQLDAESQTYLKFKRRAKFGLSAGAYDRILRVARTIADLENSANIAAQHIFESVLYRDLDKRLW